MRCKFQNEAQLICLTHHLFICLECEILHRSNNSFCRTEIMDLKMPGMNRARINGELNQRIKGLMETKLSIQKFYYNFHQKLELARNVLIREMDEIIFIYSPLMSLEFLSMTLYREFEKIPKNSLKLLRQEVSLEEINAFFKNKFFIFEEKSIIELMQEDNETRKEEEKKKIEENKKKKEEEK